MSVVPYNCDTDGIFVGRLSVVNTSRRRRWSAAEKARIVEGSLMGHRQASATARRHDIPTSLLFRWRREYRDGRLSEGDKAGGLVPGIRMPVISLSFAAAAATSFPEHLPRERVVIPASEQLRKSVSRSATKGRCWRTSTTDRQLP